MIRPRWRKVLSDLWGNKIRSLLVIASIAVGLFAVGIIATMQAVMPQDMRTGYAQVNPANIMISADPFDQDLVDQVRGIDGVRWAEGVRTSTLRLQASPGQWITVNLKAIPDIAGSQIDQVHLEQGVWPPADREIAIERYKLGDTKAQIGDEVEIELPSGKIRKLRLVGVVHDQTLGAGGLGGGFFLAPVQGYITAGTLEWLEEPDTYNQLLVTVNGDGLDPAKINQVAVKVREAVEDTGRQVISTMERTSYEHPNATYVDAISGILYLLGLLVVFLSGFLITNTLSALMNQQMQQIGIMKTVGARRYQIMSVYMALILVFGLVAFALALPLSYTAAYWMMEFLTQKINFSLQGRRVIPSVVGLQLGIALIVPQLAGFLPILQGSRLTVQEALSGYRQSSESVHRGRFDHWIRSLRSGSRPLLIALRNAFRRRGRLILTLVTLTLGGAIFIATFNVQISLTRYIDQISRYFLADVNLTLDRPYRTERIQAALSDLPDVREVEGWSAARCELLLPDGTVGESVSLLAPPANSRLVQPVMLAGRWVQPGDSNAIVLSERFRERLPGIQVGDPVRLKVNGKETDWIVVGFFQLAGKSGGFLAYANYDYLSILISQPFKATTFRVVAVQPKETLAAQKLFGAVLEDHLRASGFRVTDITEGLFLRGASSEGLSILTTFLMIMALLIALVGSIGLMGTMSMNVMERTREIGVMRAIGASDTILTKMVIVEGLVIGLTSWVLAVLLSIPITKVMSDTISRALFEAPSQFSFTPTGLLVWLGLVILLSILASVAPARNASRLTIREVLAYE